MTDLEMTRLCAGAMGFVAETIWGPICQVRCESGFGTHRFSNSTLGYWTHDYDPLHDDAQAMALVKKLKLLCNFAVGSNYSEWNVEAEDGSAQVDNEDLNRAIVECVAKMQKAKV